MLFMSQCSKKSNLIKYFFTLLSRDSNCITFVLLFKVQSKATLQITAIVKMTIHLVKLYLS